jgi:hypothetical protein
MASAAAALRPPLDVGHPVDQTLDHRVRRSATADSARDAAAKLDAAAILHTSAGRAPAVSFIPSDLCHAPLMRFRAYGTACGAVGGDAVAFDCSAAPRRARSSTAPGARRELISR